VSLHGLRRLSCLSLVCVCCVCAYWYAVRWASTSALAVSMDALSSLGHKEHRYNQYAHTYIHKTQIRLAIQIYVGSGDCVSYSSCACVAACWSSTSLAVASFSTNTASRALRHSNTQDTQAHMSHVLGAPLVGCVLPESFPLLHDLDTEGGCLLAHFIPVRCQMQCLAPVAPQI
jgi:hypothetical protein